MLKQAVLLITLSVLAGGARQYFPHGIKWNGQWPTSTTSAQDAYTMMAQPGDPAFMGLAEVIVHQEKKSAVFIDARTNEEYSAGHIPGARSLPYYEIDQYKDAALNGLTADHLIVIYCEGVGCELSFFLGRELQAGGFTNVRIFYGGFPEWKNAGFPVE